MPESDDRFEFIDEEIAPKVSPKYKHSIGQLRLLLALNQWCESGEHGRACPEWSVVLKRNGVDWVPVPDLTCVSYKRLPVEWDEDWEHLSFAKSINTH